MTVSGDVKVKELKLELSSCLGLGGSKIYLDNIGMPLDDHHTLSGSGIVKGSKIIVRKCVSGGGCLFPFINLEISQKK
jgi:hypothetical protein